MGGGKRPYHHGDLRRELLRIAADVAAQGGVSAIGLRELARAAGVSHAAPGHHFRDKRALLTALAVEGFDGLAERLEAVRDAGLPFGEQGVAYVRFAVENRGHFAVMWRFEDLDFGDEDLRRSAARAREALDAGAMRHAALTGEDPDATAAAGWSFAHGLATLVMGGLLDTGPDLDAYVRAAGNLAVGGGGSGTPTTL